MLQREAPRSRAEGLRRGAVLAAGTVVLHVGFAAALFSLLSFRDAEMPREVETPVEVVVEPRPAAPPKPAATAAEAPTPTGAGGGAQVAGGPTVDPTKPPSQGGPPPAATPTKPPDATPSADLAAPSPSPPSGPPGAAGRPPAAPSPLAGEVGPPKLLAPPPDAAKAATQDRDDKTANLVPDEHQTDAATREARPVAVPDVLTTTDPRAEATVPAPTKPPPATESRPAPPIPAKAPSETDKLAAALPLDTSAMPMSFRAVLAGNNAAQVSAAYGGVVQGRLMSGKPEIDDAAFAQRLKGAVSLVFTIAVDGRLASLDVVQSSGDPKLDALALHWIRAAAPFPPPPPDAEHTYRKALIFGH